MTTLDIGGVKAYAAAAGFQGNSLITATAIAMAESSGRTDVINASGAVGLWQILMSAHPQWTQAQLMDPYTNAKAAFQISNGGSNWSPWVTYTNGAYKQFYLQAQSTPVDQGIANDIKTGIQVLSPAAAIATGAIPAINPLDWLSNVGDFFSKLGQANTWIRIGEFVLGAGLVYVGAHHLVANSDVAKTAKSVATTAAKVIK